MTSPESQRPTDKDILGQVNSLFYCWLFYKEPGETRRMTIEHSSARRTFEVTLLAEKGGSKKGSSFAVSDYDMARGPSLLYYRAREALESIKFT